MDASGAGQRIAVPSYFYPYSVQDVWHINRWPALTGPIPLRGQVPANIVGMAIINPDSGPGAASNADYVTQVGRAKAAGVTILGYVDTSYAAREADDVQAEIDRFYAWYGVDGIFLDQASHGPVELPYYAALHQYITATARPRSAQVVLNPGRQVDEGYMGVADIIVNFEQSYVAYTDGSYTAPGWVRNYPARRFWHLVHTARTIDKMLHAVLLSKQRHAGWVYVTPDVMPNPWNTLAAVGEGGRLAGYWETERAAVAAALPPTRGRRPL